MASLVTQKDIAVATGLNQSTVSLALRDDPRVNKKTRLLVLKTARKLGYRKDPMLTALASYRDNLREKSYHGTLAWLNDPKVYELSYFQDSVWNLYLVGAQRQALLHGYKLESFEVDMTARDQHRLSDILYNRGIEGVILPPLLIPGPALKLDWSHFAAVTFGWSVTEPSFHSVSPNHYHNGTLVTRHLYARGYRRIAAVLVMTPDELDKLNFHLWAHGVEMTINVRGWQEPIPTLRLLSTEPDQKARLHEWFQKHRPDALAVMMESSTFIEATLREIGVDCPKDIGIATFASRGSESHFAGVRENSRYIGEAAVDVLVGTIRRREFGAPPIRRMLQIEGTWREGPTIKPKA
ncbi:LacI family DNA-binding transcriptional regulator [Ruficoccus sp. ZRK36]|uniref:LacI family DNA-binding transcriptional regulator n=1 Tax=Ruficoccus sp. ZRK36 TaxID=2866311 RepID=UPI001C72D2B6|nr:LacI family DNA-binding transcriptional regulator [Ruficoccus sp. ZRK36]QYY36768.1 LacI family transcriptional regulator [Ruficoccus sp. ZRK36]